MRKRKSITRLLLEDAKEYFQKYPNDKTRKAYIRNYEKYIKYCRDNFDCKTKEECALHIQDYSDYLQSQEYTASTVHSYLAAVCGYHDVNLAEIEKPLRHTAEYTRGRGNYKNSYLSSDFVTDESGYPCICIARGKGGKYHLQRLICINDDIEFIRQCFESTVPDKYVFERSEFKNKLNFHYLRAKCAQRAYRYYVDRIETEGESYIKELESQIRARWNKYNINPRTGKPKYLSPKLLTGKYYLRGKNRQFAIENGIPTEYLKLALTAVSIFHLSHWRNDVSVESYLLQL